VAASNSPCARKVGATRDGPPNRVHPRINRTQGRLWIGPAWQGAAPGGRFHAVAYDVRALGDSSRPRGANARALRLRRRLGDDWLAGSTTGTCAPGAAGLHLAGQRIGAGFLAGLGRSATQPRFTPPQAGGFEVVPRSAAPPPRRLDQVAIGLATAPRRGQRGCGGWPDTSAVLVQSRCC